MSESPTPKVEAPVQAKAAVPKPAPRAKAEPKNCACQVPGDNGCNEAKTTRVFAPGHDAKLIGFLTRKVVSGDITEDEAKQALDTRSNGSKQLASKLAHAIPREQAKKEATAKREADRLASKAAKVKKAEVVQEQIAAAKADREAREHAGV